VSRLRIHDFRVTDRVLAETDPDAGDIVYLGVHGESAFPFVVWRRVSGPGGLYVDAFDFVCPDGSVLGPWERKYEVEGSSIAQDEVTEIRGTALAGPGAYTLRYYEFDDKILEIPFQVVRQDPPYAGIVPGPLDAALSKSTIVWVAVPGEPARFGRSEAGRPVWYGYENGRIYLLVGPKEQQVPGLTEAGSVRLVARSKDKQSKVAEVECSAEVLPKNPEWDRIARDLLLGRRLNLTDGEGALARWRQTCEIVMLTPTPAPLPG
jgi:hypothetical protein